MANRQHQPSASLRNVVLLGAVSVINDTSSKIILPVLPLFVAGIGGGGIAVGIISGVGDFVASLSTLFAGYWSDRAGERKVFVISGYLISSVAKFLLAFAAVWPHVLVLRVAERVGKGVRSAPRDALLAASTGQKTRGRSFGIHRAMDSGGAVLGTLIAFGLLWFLGLGFTQVFLVAGTIGFLSLIPLGFVAEPDRLSPKPVYRFRYRDLPNSLRRFIVAAFLFALVSTGFIFASTLTAFVVLFLLYGLGYALVNANERAYVSDLVDESDRGAALGTYHMATSIASLPAGLIAGLLWDLDPVLTFAAGAGLATIAVVVFGASMLCHESPI
jgi:MFS family permease